MGLIISVFETEEPGSSPGGATKLSYDVMASITASEAVCLGSNPGETTKYPIGTGGNLIYKKNRVYFMFIYTLSSSENPDNIRYIGKAKNLKDRVRRHIGKYYLNLEDNYKNRWIKSELLKGNKILISEVEAVNETNWQEREQYWIEQFRQWGFRLVNTTEGGDGLLLTKELIKKRNKTRISNTDDKYKEYFEKYNIINDDDNWVAERKCFSCGSIIKYKSKKRTTLIANLKRVEIEKRKCYHCNSSGEMNYFYGKKLNDGKIKQERYGKKILQFDLDGNLISEFNSIREASEKTGIDRKSISNCAKGIKHYNTAKGYKFKIKE